MKKLNKKGFTLTELLAAVILLGIISSIAIVSVVKVMNKSHREYDQKQNELLTVAAQNYFADNREKLPKKILHTNSVSLAELMNNKYIDKVVDYRKKEYKINESKAIVKKMGSGKYFYCSKLVSNDGKREINNCEKKEGSNLTGRFVKYNNNGKEIEKTEKGHYFIEDEVGTYYINNKISIDFEIGLLNPETDTGEGISSYNYKIKKIDKNNKEVNYKTSGEIPVDKKEVKDVIEMDAKNYANGKYKIYIYANSYDNTQSQFSTTYIVIDKTKPKCEIQLDSFDNPYIEKIGNKYEWHNSTVDIIMKSKEENGYFSVLTKDGSYTKKYNYTSETHNEQKEDTNGTLWYGYVEDKAGNYNECEKLVKKYESQGECEIFFTDEYGEPLESYSPSADADKSIYVGSRCSDNVLGCLHCYSTHKNTYNGGLGLTYDKWPIYFSLYPSIAEGHIVFNEAKTICSQNSTIDNSIKEMQRLYTLEGEKMYEKKSYNSIWPYSRKDSLYSSLFEFVYVTKARKSFKCSIGFKSDNVAPECEVVLPKSYDGTNWYNHDVVIEGKCNDRGNFISEGSSDYYEDGVGCERNFIYSKSFSDEGLYEESPGSVRDIYGNETECEKKSFGIDKTPPECLEYIDVEGTYMVPCLDSNNISNMSQGSGCVEDFYVAKFNEDTGLLDLGTVCDHAGNCTDCGRTFIDIDKDDDDLTVKLKNEWDNKWFNKEAYDESNEEGKEKGFSIILDINSSSDIKSIERFEDGEKVKTIELNNDDNFEKKEDNKYIFTSKKWYKDRKDTEVCYKVKNNSKSIKKCTTVKIDKTKPTVGEPVNSSQCNDQTARYYAKFQIYDETSGLKSAKFTWCSSSGYNAGNTTDRHGKTKNECIAFSCNEGLKALNRQYEVCDVAGNCVKTNGFH